MEGCKPKMVDNYSVLRNKYPQENMDLTRLKEKQRCSWLVCLLVVTLNLVILLIIATGYMMFHIHELHANLSQLKHFVHMERRCNSSVHQSQYDKIYKHIEDVQMRWRRDTNCCSPFAEELQHERKEHHGIGNHNIALIYADPAKIDANNASRRYRFRPTRYQNNGCNRGYQLMTNTEGDVLCNRTNTDQVSRMKFDRGENMYRYFSKAPWMYSPDSMDNYVLTRAGEIAVKTTGMYIVQASIHFSVEGEREFPYFSVYKSDEYNNGEKIITKCVHTAGNTSELGSDDVFPCQAWQLVGLKAKDKVYMIIGSHVWFRIEKETFHLALIKLNNNFI